MSEDYRPEDIRGCPQCGVSFGHAGYGIFCSEVCALRAKVAALEKSLAAVQEALESGGELIEEMAVRFGETADVRRGVEAWHLYASELKPWLDDNRHGWRERRKAALSASQDDAQKGGGEMR